MRLTPRNFAPIAGIHRNTDNPHVHLLIHRDYIDRQTGQAKRLNTLPKEMRVSWEKAPDGTRIINPGLFSQTFEKHLDRNIKQFTNDERRKSQEERAERVTLGQAMVAADRIEQLQESLRLPAGLSYEQKERLVSRTIPEIDRRLERGVSREALFRGIDRAMFRPAPAEYLRKLTELADKPADETPERPISKESFMSSITTL